MDESLYDEFGNYIGPELSESDEVRTWQNTASMTGQFNEFISLRSANTTQTRQYNSAECSDSVGWLIVSGSCCSGTSLPTQPIISALCHLTVSGKRAGGGGA